MIQPSLSELDPAETMEGSLDPLSLYSIADSLAVKLIPGVRERQVNPRFLTLISVSFHVCEEIGQNSLPKDGVTPPWQVFEWYVVEGLVRKFKGDPVNLRTLPGHDKTRRALENGHSLSAARYLKTPSVFGFHGVYRLLSRDLRIDVGDQLGLDAGYQLLDTWVNEQGLQGFLKDRNTGKGSKGIRVLRDAVRDGYQKSVVSRKEGWQGWDFIAEHLAPKKPGKRESELIWSMLTHESSDFRSRVLNCLITEAGRRVWRNSERSEKVFHEHLRGQSDLDLADLFSTISLYERFSRLMQDAFNHTRHELSNHCSNLSASSSKLAGLSSVREAAIEIPAFYSELIARLKDYSEAIRFSDSFGIFEQHSSSSDFLHNLVDHHIAVQRDKDRAPWIHSLDDGVISLRLRYRYDSEFQSSTEYLHAYRTNSLWSFADCLGRIEHE